MHTTHSVHPEQPLFSVIIPNYNYARFLPRAIDSVLHQTMTDWELIVVDDGSKDDSRAVLTSYGNRLQAVFQENAGVSVARNHGARLARGQFLLFFDADDRLLPDALEKFQQAMHAHQAGKVFIAHHFSVSADGSERTESHPQPQFSDCHTNFRQFLKRKFSIVHGAILFHRDIFQLLQYPPGVTNGEDLVLFSQALANFPTFAVPAATVEIFGHDQRARDNVQAIRKTGLSTVDLLFDAKLLPAELMSSKAEFLARRALSMGRTFLKAKCYHEACLAYNIAWKHAPALFIDPTHCGRWWKSWWNSGRHDQ
jgi:glycosyltransferase involved in cell wall biosynthesis